ncbi:hypothetical protein CEP54_012913 [Fusarium duplospermum]|uniref:Beta-mannosidase B n=1 Tax=Fusarium duplospermum TaxID=1325734 RepID=A0A428P5Z8_9HYPO|nr:hypothetical protein CEP54_012913 [Fusarium duplospermum]
MSVAAKRTHLESGWSFQSGRDGDEEWKPVARVPTVVHMDLMDNGIISDPFLNMNEIDAEWVGETSWSYRTTFASPAQDGMSAYLLFDGLDTFAKVKLNESVILESYNMFVSHRVDITNLLRKDNTLRVDFESALLRGREIKEKIPDHQFVLFNGEAGRLAVRKAQYHWGWDWGPKLMTAGPWRPVRLEVSYAHIDDVFVKYELSDDFKTVEGSVDIEVDGGFDQACLSIRFEDDVVFSSEVSPPSTGRASIPFNINDPKLWYPTGYGNQHMYEVTANIIRNGQVLDSWTKKTGFRRSELIQRDDSHADSLLPRITPDRYRQWLQLMIDGNQIMTRVWGGGIYEEDAFYDACDELGILVWQDFMFACGNYPVWPEFIDSIRQEAKQNVQRLRHHPSVVIYAGNNEDYQVQETSSLDYDWEDKDPQSWLKTNYPARYYYEHLLPQVVAEESQGVVYWPASPFSIWHGTQEKYQTFHNLGGRFNSEFGMEAFPVLSTIQHFITDLAEYFQQSQTMDFHNKADGHERRLATYLVENFRPREDLESYVYLTQLCQSEALTYAYRGWRRQWGDDRRCGGVLVWQLNDCWPGISWAIVDYFLRNKPAFYAIARALKPLAIEVERDHHDWSVCHARPAKKLPVSVWIVNSQREVKGIVEVRFISVKTGNDIKDKILREDVAITGNGTTEALSGEVDNIKEEPHVIAVRLLVDGVCVSRSVDWPQPMKYLDLSERNVKVDLSDGQYVITAQRPTKGVVLEEVDGVTLSDNCVDIVPGDEIRIAISGSGSVVPSPKFKYLGQL